MHEATELVRALAWPVTTLIIFVIFRTEIRRFTRNVADRIQSASSISIGPRGFEFRGVVRVAPIPADVQARKVALARFVRGLSDKAILDGISDALHSPRSSDLRTQINDVVVEMNRRVDGERGMDELSAILRSLTGRSF